MLAAGNPVLAEIFCIEASNINKCKELITFAAKCAFDNGQTEILFMADENTISHRAALSVGFINTGFYKGYMIQQAK